MEGLRKNVRSGFNIKVWTDPWIPLTPPRPAKDNGVYRDPHLYVNHFIDFDSKEWKIDLIQYLIEPSDVPLILGLKPSRTFQMDNYCWSYTKSGLYTVKTGYQIACQRGRSNDEVSEPSTKRLKSQVWKLKTARKLKHFLWNAISGSLATCSRLADRHCGTDRSCPRCGEEDESINHLLFECPPAVQAWALSCVPCTPGSFPSGALFTNFDFLFWRARDSGVPENQLQLVPWLLWFIWKARNEKTFNGKEISPLDTVALATSESESWAMAQVIENLAEEEEADPQRYGADVVTLNVGINANRIRCQIDASWCIEDQNSGMGFILLDTPAPLLGLKSAPRFLSPLHAELEALSWAMEMVHQRGFNKVQFETDCADILKLMDDAEEWPAFSAELEVINSLRLAFTDFSIFYIPRLNNVRADGLAKGARVRGLVFSHVSYRIPEWLPHEASLFDQA